MTAARLVSARGLLSGLAAGGLCVAALLQPASVLWTALWPVVVLAACRGYGLALERATGHGAGPALSTLGGLAVLVTGSVVLGHVGALTLHVQLGAIALGLLCCGLAPRAPRARDGSRASLVQATVTIAVATALAAAAIARLDLVIMDGLNHSLVVKRLWDTGSLGRIYHQLGGQPVAESYFAIAPGAWAASLFEASAAPALVIALLFERLAARSAGRATALWCMLAIPIALAPTLLTSQWSAVALLAAAFFDLSDATGDAIEDRRTAWHAIACSLALAVTRHEYALLALPYLTAAIVLPRPAPPSRRTVRALATAWIAVLVPLQVALSVPVDRALVNAVILLAAWPLARATLAVFGAPPAPGALAVLVFSSITFGLALALDAIRPAQHDAAATFAVAFAAVACLAALLAQPAQPAQPAPVSPMSPAIIALLVLCLATTAIAPNLDGNLRGKLTRYFTEALVTIKYRRATGDGLGPHRDLRAMQERVPEGATIGFWGQRPGALDFRRNRITDRSWPRNRFREEFYLLPLTQESLRGQDYMLVERVLPAPAAVVPWDIAHATVYVDDLLERVACLEAVCVYAVRR